MLFEGWCAQPLVVGTQYEDLARHHASDGLTKKHTAPSRNARTRADSSGNAVMKMIGTVRPWLRRRVCSSRPLMSDILTSVITRDAPSNWGARRNSAADANVCTV